MLCYVTSCDTAVTQQLKENKALILKWHFRWKCLVHFSFVYFGGNFAPPWTVTPPPRSGGLPGCLLRHGKLMFSTITMFCDTVCDTITMFCDTPPSPPLTHPRQCEPPFPVPTWPFPPVTCDLSSSCSALFAPPPCDRLCFTDDSTHYSAHWITYYSESRKNKMILCTLSWS